MREDPDGQPSLQKTRRAVVLGGGDRRKERWGKLRDETTVLQQRRHPPVTINLGREKPTGTTDPAAWIRDNGGRDRERWEKGGK